MPLYSPPPTTSSAVPTLVVADATYTVSENTQVPFKQTIQVDAGATIKIEPNAVLIQDLI